MEWIDHFINIESYHLHLNKRSCPCHDSVNIICFHNDSKILCISELQGPLLSNKRGWNKHGGCSVFAALWETRNLFRRLSVQEGTRQKRNVLYSLVKFKKTSENKLCSEQEGDTRCKETECVGHLVKTFQSDSGSHSNSVVAYDHIHEFLRIKSLIYLHMSMGTSKNGMFYKIDKFKFSSLIFSW